MVKSQWSQTSSFLQSWICRITPPHRLPLLLHPHTTGTYLSMTMSRFHIDLKHLGVWSTQWGHWVFLSMVLKLCFHLPVGGLKAQHFSAVPLIQWASNQFCTWVLLGYIHYCTVFTSWLLIYCHIKCTLKVFAFWLSIMKYQLWRVCIQTHLLNIIDWNSSILGWVLFLSFLIQWSEGLSILQTNYCRLCNVSSTGI